MTTIILASNNSGKIKEINKALANLNIIIRPQSDFAVSDIAETGLTFIENAFKHGVINETEKATIKLNLESKKGQIIFGIENTKPQNGILTISDKSKIGLENVRKQLDLLYPKKHQLEMEETQTLYKVQLSLYL